MVTPFVTTYGYLHFQKMKVREEVKEQLLEEADPAELVLLKFTQEESDAQLRWEHSREFEYNGQMYDIARTETKGDTTYYWCIWDHAETALNNQLDELVAQAFGNNPRTRERQHKLADFYNSLFYSEHPPLPDRNAPVTLGFLNLSRNYSGVSHDPPVPPPRFG